MCCVDATDGPEQPLGAFDPLTTYDEAVSEYEDASSDFWRHLSDHTVRLLELQAGERVLDVPCGTGHSAVPAAARVGPSGRVVALDVSERMAQLVRGKAAAHGLGNLEVGVADMARLGPPDAPFDAVVCVLGIFFVPDMAAALRTLVSQVRPGGRIGVAVFGESFFEPLRTIFVEAVNHEAPDVEVIEPWSRVRTEVELRELFTDAGLRNVAIEERVDHLPLVSAEDWWRIVMGSGLRAAVERLRQDAVDRVRACCFESISRQQITALRTTSRYGIAVRR
jgi:ubiquinone/menaquinone biosynthesis C-methylase UbiE